MKPMVAMLNDIALGNPLGSTSSQYGIESSTMGLLADPAIRRELEMVDSQYQELQELDATIQKRVADQIRGMDFSDSDNLVARIRSIREQANRELRQVLLPHQIDRLRQIRAQSRLRYRSLADVLTNEPVKSDLDISEEQSRELREAERRIEEELQREIAELRKKARKKLLETLNRSQQEQVREMFGPDFKFPAREKGPEKGDKSQRRK